MKEYSCIIIDDETKAIEVLKDTIEELYTNIKIAGTYTKWKDAVIALKNNHYDIVFLDISMPEKSGFDVLSFVPDLKSEVIFVTAHPEFALDAFNYMATGYLLKPVDDIALAKTIEKTITRIEAKINNRTGQAKKIAIPNNKGFDYLDQDDIFYLEAVGKHTKILTMQKEYLSTQPFGIFAENLSYAPFYQVHRSFIVNINGIVRYESTGVLIMKNGATVPISKNIREGFLKQFGKMM